MLKPKIEKSVLLLIATLITGLFIFLLPLEYPVISIVNTYVVVVNGFLLVNVASMINKTSEMKIGEYHDLKRYRYILSLIYISFLIFLSYKMERMETFSTLGSGALAILGLWISGLQGNKIATHKTINKSTE